MHYSLIRNVQGCSRKQEEQEKKEKQLYLPRHISVFHKDTFQCYSRELKTLV